MSKKKTVFIIVALIILIGGSAALSYLFISLKPESPQRPSIDKKRFVKTEVVNYYNVISPLSAKGRVISSNEVALVAEASGKIQQGGINLKKGTSFQKGQLLAVIYKDEFELALKARKSDFLNTIATLLPDLKIDFPDYEEDFVRFFNAIDINEDFPKLPDYSDEKLKVYLASRNFLSEYYSILQDEKKLSRHSLYAPFNGTLTNVNYEVGTYANTGAQIAQMIRTDQLEVEVPVKNLQSKWIKIGDHVKVLSNHMSSNIDGIVVRKADFIDEATQSRSVFVKVSHSKTDLLAGEYMNVEFPGQIIEGAKEIPRNAVFNSNEVFVVVNGMLKKQVVNILKWNENTLVFNGLKEGLHIVVEPLINARENSSVEILGDKDLSDNNVKIKSGSNSNTQSKPK